MGLKLRGCRYPREGKPAQLTAQRNLIPRKNAPNQGFWVGSTAKPLNRNVLPRKSREASANRENSGLLGGRVPGCFRGGLAIPGGDQFGLDPLLLVGFHCGLSAIRRQVMHREVATCLLRSRGRISGQTHSRQISDLCGAAADCKCCCKQRPHHQQLYRSIHRHPRNPNQRASLDPLARALHRILAHQVKPLSPETIKGRTRINGRTREANGEASLCRNRETLTQRNN